MLVLMLVLVAGTMRPAFTSRPSDQQAQGSAGATDSVWQEPPIVFHGAEDPLQHTSSSTPAKLAQAVKKGIVKFKEVPQATAQRLFNKFGLSGPVLIIYA